MLILVMKKGISVLSLFYGHPTLAKRNEVWKKLEQLGRDINGRWLCIGDFNQVLDFEDKLTIKYTGIQGSQELRSCLSNLSLLPIESKGLSYTWKNKRPGFEFVMEKLGRVFANWEWCNAYPHCLIKNLPIMCSDHGPILLDTTWRPPFGQRPFRFEWMWTLDITPRLFWHNTRSLEHQLSGFLCVQVV